MPEGARVFEILESHAHKLRRWTIGKVGGASRQRQPGSDALQFIEQAGMFGQPFRAWMVETVLSASKVPLAAASSAPNCESGPRAPRVIKLGIDVHLDRYVVVR